MAVVFSFDAFHAWVDYHSLKTVNNKEIILSITMNESSGLTPLDTIVRAIIETTVEYESPINGKPLEFSTFCTLFKNRYTCYSQEQRNMTSDVPSFYITGTTLFKICTLHGEERRCVGTKTGKDNVTLEATWFVCVACAEIYRMLSSHGHPHSLVDITTALQKIEQQPHVENFALFVLAPLYTKDALDKISHSRLTQKTLENFQTGAEKQMAILETCTHGNQEDFQKAIDRLKKDIVAFEKRNTPKPKAAAP